MGERGSRNQKKPTHGHTQSHTHDTPKLTHPFHTGSELDFFTHTHLKSTDEA